MKIISFIGCLAIATNVCAQGSWSEDSASAFVAVAGAGGCVLGGKIWILGGAESINVSDLVDTVQIFDPDNHTWSAAPSMTFERTDFACSELNGRIYAIGGSSYFSQLDTVEMYDTSTKVWTPLQSMPFPRSVHCTVVVNNKIYVIGGVEDRFLNSLEIFDPSTNTWNAGQDMPTARDAFTCSVINDKIYAMGGENIYSEAIDTVEIYDPSSNSWSIGPPMLTGLMGCTSSVIDGKIYVVGGFAASKTLEIFDPPNNTWSYGPDMPTGRRGLVSGTVNGKMYAIGGVQGINDIPVGVNEVFTPDDNAVSKLPASHESISTYPNPFTHSTTIRFTSPESGFASVQVFNQLGEAIANVFSGEVGVGEHSWSWIAPQSLSDGIYECIVRMNSGLEHIPIIVSR